MCLMVKRKARNCHVVCILPHPSPARDLLRRDEMTKIKAKHFILLTDNRNTSPEGTV